MGAIRPAARARKVARAASSGARTTSREPGRTAPVSGPSVPFAPSSGATVSSMRRACTPCSSVQRRCSSTPASPSPSTSTVGRRRRASPAATRRAVPAAPGRRAQKVMRTTKASTSTPTASATAIGCSMNQPEVTKPANTETMISAAAVTTGALAVKPRSIAPFASPVCTNLAHAGDEEDLVVHREAEQHAHHHDRHEGDDRTVDVHEQRAVEPAVLEHHRGHAEGGDDGEEVADRGLQRHPDRAEHQGEQDQGQADDEQREGQQRAGELVGDVDADGGRAGHGDVGDLQVLLPVLRARAHLGDEVLGGLLGGAALGITTTTAMSAPWFGVAS